MGRTINAVGRFEKVSFEQFRKDWLTLFHDSEEKIREIYDAIELPKRATKGSAGYDFYAPIDIHFPSNVKVKIPTGLRVHIDEGWVLQIFPRSSLGFKYGLRLSNTTGIIDSDYVDSDNEGHMFMSLICDNEENIPLDVKQGNALVQGIFIPFGITSDDETTTVRNGGFGSTNK